SILHDSPFAQLCASLQVLHFVSPLRVMRMSAQSFRSSSLRGGNTFSNNQTKRRSKNDAERDSKSRYSEVVSVTRGSSQQARPDHGRLQRVLELQRGKSNPRARSMPTARHPARANQYVSEVAD